PVGITVVGDARIGAAAGTGDHQQPAVTGDEVLQAGERQRRRRFCRNRGCAVHDRSTQRGNAGTAVGWPSSPSAIITKVPLVDSLRSPVCRSSVTSSTSTVLELRPTRTTRPMVSTICPTRIGSLKSTWSERAVTTVWRE